MGCGPNVFHLFQIADTLIQENRQHRSFSEPASHGVAVSAEGLRKELDEMYIQGTIDERAYRALRKLAEGGQLRPVDLAVHRVGARRTTRGHQTTLPEEERARRQLRTRLLEIERAREDSLRVLESLKQKLDVLEKEALRREQAAREVVSEDEEKARRHLQAKQAFLATRENLNKQITALEEDIARLNDLYVSIQAKLAELDALEAREKVQEVILS